MDSSIVYCVHVLILAVATTGTNPQGTGTPTGGAGNPEGTGAAARLLPTGALAWAAGAGGVLAAAIAL
jgi:hypothetical protein